MPWRLKTYKKAPKGHKGRYCARNLRTGKLYCSKTASGREKMMRLHEKFRHMKGRKKR